jgi:hypothetical protein
MLSVFYPTSFTSAPRVVAVAPLPRAPVLGPVARIPDALKQRGLTPLAASRESDILRRIGALDDKYNPMREQALAALRAGLSGLGGYTVKDNGEIVYDPSAGPGDRERDAVLYAKAAANSGGRLYSSRTGYEIGSALSRLSAEAQQVLTQYATALQNIGQAEQNEFDTLNSGLYDLYSQDGSYNLENPPPVEVPMPAAGPPAPAPGVPGPQQPPRPGGNDGIYGPWVSEPTKLDRSKWIVWRTMTPQGPRWFAKPRQ